MSWASEETARLRGALKAAGFKRADTSIVAKISASQIVATIKTKEHRRAAEVITKEWYSRNHAWLYLWVYGADGRQIFGDLSDGYIPPHVAARIASLPNHKADVAPASGAHVQRVVGQTESQETK